MRTRDVVKKEKKHYCQNCKFYKRPKCRNTNSYTTRKGTCGDWEGK
jgi:hypothetical protein